MSSPIHPGEILREEFMDPREITASQLARDIGVPPNRICQILQGRRAITADTAVRLGAVFGTAPAFWLNLQSRYELARAALLGAQ